MPHNDNKKLATKSSQKGERIAKVLARAGIASRREVERMIAAGRISVDGTLLTTPAFLITGHEKILVDGKPIEAKQSPRLWRYHKPVGLLTTHNDPGGRPTVFENLPKDLPRVISIGRLDMTSEGLLLLTNDGELARKLELPRTGFARKYRARAYGKPTQTQLDKLKHGVKIDGIQTGPIEATLDKQQGTNAWISITIREGKNREVRRALETIGLKVNRLIRISYGPIQLGDLMRGKVEEIKPKVLRDQLGHLVDIPKERPAGTLKGKAKMKSNYKGKKGTRRSETTKPGANNANRRR
ncbi:MAG: pseudouridylate synthase [Robiginitomaculum sp.]|nr:MAG: pseudouridylate synthase [Robiginitomaculum sp.]PHQ67888.1 MAG: pseudouridylate synthase [Robiginitomaculum sp.]